MDREMMFVSMVCSTHRQPTVLRFKWDGDTYIALGASKQRPGCVIPPGDGAGAVRASFGTTSDYPGCPYCGSDGFVRCGNCRELNRRQGSHDDRTAVVVWSPAAGRSTGGPASTSCRATR